MVSNFEPYTDVQKDRIRLAEKSTIDWLIEDKQKHNLNKKQLKRLSSLFLDNFSTHWSIIKRYFFEIVETMNHEGNWRKITENLSILVGRHTRKFSIQKRHFMEFQINRCDNNFSFFIFSLFLSNKSRACGWCNFYLLSMLSIFITLFCILNFKCGFDLWKGGYGCLIDVIFGW